MRRLAYSCSIGMLGIVVLLSGCMSNQAQTKVKSENRSSEYKIQNTNTDQLIDTNEQEAVIPIFNHEGREYVSLRKLTDILEFNVDWNPETERLQVGDNDVAYEIPTSSSNALKEGEQVNFENPPVTIEGVTYIPKNAVELLFGEAMNHTWTNEALHIQPNEEMSLEDAANLPDFQDDPNDPSTDITDTDTTETSYLPTTATSGFGELSLANVNSNKLITTAKKYIGVKYLFGAGPFPKTNRFDCSTFTQYVYGQHNVKLPRLSRTQAKQGVSVSRTNLRKGDLMFFYLPGRYKSNKIVGHVGIYMGNGNMIHSSNQPKNGVQITSINKSYWKKTYLKSRRVAK